jgi:hypothetical protein
MPKKTRANKRKRNRDDRLHYLVIVLVVALVVLAVVTLMIYLRLNAATGLGHGGGLNSGILPSNNTASSASLASAEKRVLPAQGYTLPVKWGTAPKMLVGSGALSVSSLSQILQQSGQQLTPDELSILNGTSTENITINSTDAPFVLYLLWSIGINDNDTIISDGPIMHFGGNPDNLASTGGYAPLGRLSLGQLDLMSLTPQQQATADYVAENTYRPCCNNPTMFPDCNHGAAALGLIELMTSQGDNQSTIFDGVRDFDAMAFPNQYVTIAEYLTLKGSSWNETSAETLLSSNFSSASGFSQIQSYVSAHQSNGQQGSSGGSSCGA